LLINSPIIAVFTGEMPPIPFPAGGLSPVHLKKMWKFCLTDCQAYWYNVINNSGKSKNPIEAD
jgi:hypothetical protein